MNKISKNYNKLYDLRKTDKTDKTDKIDKTNKFTVFNNLIDSDSESDSDEFVLATTATSATSATSADSVDLDNTDGDSECGDSECGDLICIDTDCDLSTIGNIFISNKHINQSVSAQIESSYSESSYSESSHSESPSVYTDESTKSVNDHLYCSKCLMKKKANTETSEIEIFNITNDIIFSSATMPEVYAKMDKLIIRADKWFELNSDGLSVFHWFIWYISTKIKKYNHVKSRVFAFFQKIFSDNTVRSIFGNNMINKILIFGTPKNPNHTILYHLVRYCENPNDIFYMRLYNLLLERGCKPLTDNQLKEIKLLNSEEEDLPLMLKHKVSSITDKYKLEESKIVKDIETKYLNCKLNNCIECEKLIDYTKEIPKIIEYAKNNKCEFLLNCIWSAYYQRKLLNTIFNKYYNKVNAKSNLNLIHKRHSHILELYKNSLIDDGESDSISNTPISDDIFNSPNSIDSNLIFMHNDNYMQTQTIKCL